MKKYLENIIRKSKQEKKSNYEIVLSQNERNLPLPKSLFNKFKSSINQQDIFQYPNTEKFKNKLSKHLGLQAYNIMLTPGSDIGIKTIFETFDVKDKNIITTNFCFPMYEVYSQLYQTKLKKARYKGLHCDSRQIIKLIDKNTQFIIIANPNSPVGDRFSVNEIQQLLDTGVHVIIDEAYIELSQAESVVDKVRDYDNLTVLRTFSKGYGAAGCRVGYIISNKQNIDLYSKFRFMYEIGGIDMKYCDFILDNITSYKRYLEKTLEEKQELFFTLGKSGLRICNTSSSWIFIQSSKEVLGLFEKHRILVKTCKLPVDENEWIKLNYDLVLKDSQFIKDLVSL